MDEKESRQSGEPGAHQSNVPPKQGLDYQHPEDAKAPKEEGRQGAEGESADEPGGGKRHPTGKDSLHKHVTHHKK